MQIPKAATAARMTTITIRDLGPIQQGVHGVLKPLNKRRLNRTPSGKIKLPSKRPEDADKSDEPNFYPYHRVLGHSIEDCWVFKDWVEKAYKNGEITLPKGFLQSPSAHEQTNMISHEEEKIPGQLSEDQEEQWTTHLSK
jgi:hypothetical protein